MLVQFQGGLPVYKNGRHKGSHLRMIGEKV